MNLLVYSISGSLDRFRCYALFRIKSDSLLRDCLSEKHLSGIAQMYTLTLYFFL